MKIIDRLSIWLNIDSIVHSEMYIDGTKIYMRIYGINDHEIICICDISNISYKFDLSMNLSMYFNEIFDFISKNLSFEFSWQRMGQTDRPRIHFDELKLSKSSICSILNMNNPIFIKKFNRFIDFDFGRENKSMSIEESLARYLEQEERKSNVKIQLKMYLDMDASIDAIAYIEDSVSEISVFGMRCGIIPKRNDNAMVRINGVWMREVYFFNFEICDDIPIVSFYENNRLPR